MNRSAHVTSLEAIREFRAALLAFEQEVRDTLDQLVLEQRRAEDWFIHDRTRYWPHQFRLASDLVHETRTELERCEMAIRPDERPSCLQQKKAFERAKRRQRLTEEKREAARKWATVVRHETDDFLRTLSGMRDALDTQLAMAVHKLEKLSEALDRYTDVSRPSPPPSPPGNAQEPSA